MVVRRDRTRGRRWPYAVAAAVAIFAVWLLLPGRDGKRRGSSAPAEPSAGEWQSAPPQAPAPGPGTHPPSSLPARPPGMPDPGGLAKRDVVSDTVWATRFPPNSQPLRPEMTDIIRPNHRYESAMPVSAKGSGPNGIVDPNSDLYYLLTADVLSIPSGSPAVATLKVFRGSGGDASPLQVDITGVRLMQFAQPSFVPVQGAQLSMVDDGTGGDALAGDHVYTLSFIPSSIPALATYDGQIRLEVDFVADSASPPKTGALVFMTTGQAPAVFTGNVSEQLTPQGLTITAEIQVSQPGDFVLQGLLFDASGKPIGFAAEHPTFAAQGTQTVSFLFFGLLFYEAQAVSPYHFRTMTGYRLPDPGQPHKTDMPVWNGDYTTQAYKLSDFSPAEWDSQQRQQAIANAQTFAAARPQGDPLPPPPPELVGKILPGGPQPGSGGGTTSAGAAGAPGAGGGAAGAAPH